MVACKCPRCEVVYSLRPVDHKQWPKDFEKYRLSDGTYALLCFKCWEEMGKPLAHDGNVNGGKKK